MPLNLKQSKKIFTSNRKVIPGGVVSINRAIQPEISFIRGRGSRVWDADDHEYIDYHAAFSPYLLGHCDPDVDQAVKDGIDDNLSLMGSGTNPWEGELAALMVKHIPSVDKAMFANSGSEVTYAAIRLARSYTGRNGVILMQGGYNGWHNDVAYNIMNSVDQIGPYVSPGEYPLKPITAGIPDNILQNIHVINYNDLDSVELMIKNFDIAAIILEPILQNIGIVKPQPGYLEGLRKICDRQGVVLIFDEVKTGFRHALGGYQSICGVLPDLCTFGKAMANGYPIGAIGGKEAIMHYLIHEDLSKRVLIAGTYNGHPIPTLASIATIKKLEKNENDNYARLYALGDKMQRGLEAIFSEFGITATIARQGSAFCVYFMDHEPIHWHDVAEHHDFAFDTKYRTLLIDEGIYHFPMPTKQGSISMAHTDKDIELTLEKTRTVLKKMQDK